LKPYLSNHLTFALVTDKNANALAAAKAISRPENDQGTNPLQ
jgi:hypothetical protein